MSYEEALRRHEIKQISEILQEPDRRGAGRRGGPPATE